MPLKILVQEKITQTSEHKHNEIEHFSTLNERIISQNSKESVTVNKLSDLHWSVTVISRQY